MRILLSALLLVATGAFISLLAPVEHSSALSSTNYTNRLIDDAVFRDKSTMDPNAIQSFLANKGSYLAGYSDIEDCGATNGAHYNFYRTYYSCGNRVSAAKIIYDAAQAYGINPRVILATLQKEQSLITSPNPTSSQINYAMGYGCPDSCGCSFAGFFNQVDNGTWQFRTDMELGGGNNWWGYTPASYPCNTATRYYSGPLKSGSTITFYDDNGTAYNTFTLSGMATATLYCYTPHAYNNPTGANGNPRYGTTGLYYSGSYNFVKSFTDWWGTTYGSIRLTGSPGSVSWGYGRLDIFARGGDGNLWQKYYDASAYGWGGWAPLNVSIDSSPTVTSWGVGRLDIFYADAMGTLQHHWYGGGSWQTVESLGQPSPSVTIIDSPGAVSWGSGRIDIFARGSDNALWQKTYDGANGGWQAWNRIGGTIWSSPSPSSWSAGRLDVFTGGPAGDLEHFWYVDSTWHQAESLGKPSSSVDLSTAPGGISWSQSRIDVFTRGSDGVLWQKWFDSTGWHPWVRFTGVLSSAPSMSSWAPQRLDEFSTGPAGDLQHYWFSGNWGTWESLGQPL